mmetsp:Transcript_11479/g.20900  ORF Transcript_11479/g.20900 Transcript_11479/m.20900 type:complete len:254 (-) Transcript_11479:1441-2202(-)
MSPRRSPPPPPPMAGGTTVGAPLGVGIGAAKMSESRSASVDCEVWIAAWLVVGAAAGAAAGVPPPRSRRSRRSPPTSCPPPTAPPPPGMDELAIAPASIPPEDIDPLRDFFPATFGSTTGILANDPFPEPPSTMRLLYSHALICSSKLMLALNLLTRTRSFCTTPASQWAKRTVSLAKQVRALCLMALVQVTCLVTPSTSEITFRGSRAWYDTPFSDVCGLSSMSPNSPIHQIATISNPSCVPSSSLIALTSL